MTARALLLCTALLLAPLAWAQELSITLVGPAPANANANTSGYVVLGRVSMPMPSDAAAVAARNGARVWMLTRGAAEAAVLLAVGADGEPLETGQ